MDFREFSMGYGLWAAERDERGRGWKATGSGRKDSGYETTGEKLAAIRIK